MELILAVGVGVATASLLFVKRQSDLQLTNISLFRKGTEAGILDFDKQKSLAKLAMQKEVLLFHFGSALSFGIAKAMANKLSDEKNNQLLILDLSDV